MANSQRPTSVNGSRGAVLAGALGIAFVLVGGLAGRPSLPMPQGTSDCFPFDSFAAGNLEYLDSIATRLDSGSMEWRDSLNLPRTTSDSVRYVTDQATCDAAAAAFDQLLSEPPRVRSIYVFAVGSYFAVIDPTRPLGEFTQMVFFTREWQYLAGIGGG